MRIDARILLIAPAIICFFESALFILRPFSIPEPIAGILYPQLMTLNSYCSKNACLYEPLAVASLYSVQLLSFLAFWIFLFILGRRNKSVLDQSVVAICAVVVGGSLIDYLTGNFYFDQKWILPNTITTSQLGVFRYAVLFSIASIGVVILTNSVKPKET